MSCKNQVSFYYGKSFSQQCRGSNPCVSVLKVTSTIVFVGLQTFTMGGGMHGPF